MQEEGGVNPRRILAASFVGAVCVLPGVAALTFVLTDSPTPTRVVVIHPGGAAVPPTIAPREA